VKHPYTVRLTSDDVTSERVFHLTKAQRDFLLEVAAAFNADARFTVDHRVYVEPTSAAPTGDVA